MMQTASLLGLVAAGLWLAGIGVYMFARPEPALGLLALTASTWRINVTELGLRMLAGLALVVRSEVSKAPSLFEVVGWFVILSSAILLAVPRRLHAAFAIWWSRTLRPAAVRVIGLFSIVAAAGLIYAAV